MCEQSQQLRNEIASMRNDVTLLQQQNQALRQELYRANDALQPIRNLVVFTQDAP